MLTSAALLLALQAPPLAFLRHPDIHGDKVTFACEGDIWIGDLNTGNATRLTRSDAQEREPRFSPDGSKIAFTGAYGGMDDIYLIPATGGAPTRVTFQNDYAWMMDWMPDGKSLTFRARSVPRSFGLFRASVSGGYPERLPLEFVSHASFAPDGNRFVFTRIFRSDEAWFRYQGGRKNDVWVGDLASKSFKKIVTTANTNEFPVWAGERVFFVTDDNGKFSVNSISPDGKGLKRVAGPYTEEVRFLQTDGKRLIYEKGVGLEMVDLQTGAVSNPKFGLTSDLIYTLPFLVPAQNHVMAAHLGPTGKRILIESRGQIVSLPGKEGDARVVLAKDGVRYRYPVFSSDGKQMAYISDETGEQQIYVADSEGGSAKAVTQNKVGQIRRMSWSPDAKWLGFTDSDNTLRALNTESGQRHNLSQGSSWNGPPFDFSPDSKWIAYQDVDPITFIGHVVLFELATAKKTVVSDGLSDDTFPVFSPDGKYLAFLSKRNVAPTWDSFLNQLTTQKPMRVVMLALSKKTKSPFLAEDEEEGTAATEPPKEDPKKPVEIDLDGLYARQIPVPIPPGNYYSPIDFAGDRLIYAVDGNIHFYDLKAKKGGVVTAGPAFQVSDDGKKLLVGAGASLRVVDATATDAPANTGQVSFGNLQLRINPREEWKNMYWDAWRLLRDYFYVENLHGADWDAIGKKYAAYLPYVRSRWELTELLRWLQSELATGHMYRNDGDVRSLQQPATPAFLGVDLEPDPSGFYKIKRIFRGDGYDPAETSPLAQTGLDVEEGDFLIEVAGRPAKVGTNFMEGLVNRVGQTVAIKVNDTPMAAGARTLHVKPAANERPMRYRQWVMDNRDYVSKKTNGKVGYIHLQAMSIPDMADFIEQYFPQRDKDALVIDVRFNGGGNISNNVITVLKQKLVAYFNQRSAPNWSRQGEFFAGHLVCLINEFSGSNGEEFPHHFKALNLGPLMGKRTWGGEVGSDPGWPLADGGQVWVPNYGAWTPEDGWIIEGPGVAPDVEVESDPNVWARGGDHQLDRAIEYLLAEIKRRPVVHPVPPDGPKRAGGG